MASRFVKKITEEMEKAKVDLITEMNTAEDLQKAKGYYAGLLFALSVFKATDRAENDEDGENL